MATIVGQGGVLLVGRINENAADGFARDAVENRAMNGGRRVGSSANLTTGLCVCAEAEQCTREKDRQSEDAEPYSAVQE